MEKNDYKKAKNMLKSISIEAKKAYENDKPAIRMSINDSIDHIVSDCRLSDYQRGLLCNYACTLHPKD